MKSAAITWRRGDEVTAAELYALLSLRVDVFIIEQDCVYPETDGRDLLPSTKHGFFVDEGGVTAAVRLLADESPPRIGRVVTRVDARGAGLAALLVEAAHIEAGAPGTRLDAQTYLVDWYQQLGWVVDGAEFIEDGIPHTPMIRASS